MKLCNFSNIHRAAVLCLSFFLSSPGLKAEAPKVVKASPDNGDENVNPSLSEMRIEFDQPMSQGGMSIVGGGPSFPKLIGKPRWANETTLILTWRLEPEHDYWLSINSQRFQNFRNLNGEPAQPYPIAFKTGTGNVSSNAPDNNAAQVQLNREGVTHLKRALDEDYSYRDLRKVDWEQRFKDFTPKLEAANSPRQFANLAAQLLAPAQDIHLWLRVGQSTVYSWQRRAAWNVARNHLPGLVPRWQKRNEMISTGQFDDGIRYLYISSWPADGRELLEPAYEMLTDAMQAGKPLLIDVRANGGGSETLAAEFAGCFVSQPVVYAKHITRHDGKFSPPRDRTLQPNGTRAKFKGRVIVLAGAGTVSSCESFVMMMKQVPGCTIVGQHTAGCSGNPKPVDLGNGVVVFFPSWKDLSLDGTCLEGIGFPADVVVKATQEQFKDGDPVLDAALGLLR